jgi:hypothetical protein
VSQCDRVDPKGVRCPKVGTWKPVLILRVHGGHEPARCEVGLAVCDEHRQKEAVDDLLDEGMWESVASAFRATGKALPRRELTRIEWLSVGN